MSRTATSWRGRVLILCDTPGAQESQQPDCWRPHFRGCGQNLLRRYLCREQAYVVPVLLCPSPAAISTNGAAGSARWCRSPVGRGRKCWRAARSKASSPWSAQEWRDTRLWVRRGWKGESLELCPPVCRRCCREGATRQRPGGREVLQRGNPGTSLCAQFHLHKRSIRSRAAARGLGTVHPCSTRATEETEPEHILLMGVDTGILTSTEMSRHRS